MGFEFDATAEDIRVFLDEAEELLQLMEEDILKLEKDGENTEYLQEVFRAAHTLKGSSATLGHRKMAQLTHSMENVLDKLRKGKLVFTTAVVNTLFACLDVLKSFKQEIATGEDAGISIDEILSRLAALDDPKEVQAPQPDKPSQRLAGSAMPSLEPEAEAILAAGLKRGLMPVWATMQIDKDASMPAVRAFQVLLAVGDLGDLVRSWPTQEEVEADQVSEELKLLFVSDKELQEIRTVLAATPEIKLTALAHMADDRSQADQGGTPQQAAAAALAGPAAPQRTPAGQPPSAVAHPAPAERQTGASTGQADRTPGGQGRQAQKHSSRTIRVDVEVLDNLMSLVGELVIERTRLHQVLNRLETELEGDEITQVMSGALAHIGRLSSDLQEEIQRARMLPVDNLFKKFPRMVRDTAHKAGKEIEFVVLGEETELDRSVIEEIGDPLMHLLRNAVDHGLEMPADRITAGKPSKGTVVLEAFHEENNIIISVRDDGRGIDPAKVRASAVRKGLLTEEAARRMSDYEVVNLIWRPGFSTAEKVSEVSGRGVGLDVVQKNIERLNGSVDVRTEAGKGTEFRVKLPLTLAIIRSLQVQVLETTYCIPLGSVVETDRIPISDIRTVRQREVIVKRGEVIPLIRLVQAFRLDRPDGYQEPDEMFVVIVAVHGKQIGLVVDNLVGEGDVVIKPLGKFIGDVPGISGATIMGDGDVAIILDISSLVNTVQAEIGQLQPAH